MKKIFCLIGLLSMTGMQPAFAQGFSADQLVEATQVALNEFKNSNSSHGVHLTGFKTWISADEAKVKIYVNHDGMNMDFNYLCQLQQTKVLCTAQ